MERNKPYRSFPLPAGILLFAAAILCLLAAGRLEPAQAAPQAQVPIYTPTPGPDGRIVYIVKANDTLLSISLLTGVPVDELRELNSLSDDIIVEGEPLLLGVTGSPDATPTVGPSPTPTPVLPTATPKPGFGKICVLLFNDQNGDSIRQEAEPSIPEGAINVNNRAGTVSLTTTSTADAEHHCFEDVPEGSFNISVAVPEGFNATTVTNYALTLDAGDETYVNFGAQARFETLAEAPEAGGSGRRPVLGILGGALLVLGVGLALFAGRLLKSR